MNRIAVIAICGLAVSAVCLGVAAAIGVREFPGGNINFSMFDGMGDCQPGHATATSRSFPWDGGDSVSISIPANLHYAPGSGTTLEAKGDPELLAHLKVSGGEIETDCHVRGWNHQRIDITLPGRSFTKFELAGIASLDLQNLAQDTLNISIAGSGDVTATGKVDDMRLEIAGRGDAHLKDLTVQKLNLDIAGRGDVEASPIDHATVDIAGSGTVKLYTEPKHIDASIMGSGNIEHLANKS